MHALQNDAILFTDLCEQKNAWVVTLHEYPEIII